MAKTFDIVKKRNLLTGEERAVSFFEDSDEESKGKILKKLNRSLKGKDAELFEFFLGESLYMHLLPGLSDQTVRELSKRMYHTAYVVCKKNGKGEKVLYLSLLKDTALRFRASIPAAVIKVGNRDVLNPDFYVRELRLCL